MKRRNGLIKNSSADTSFIPNVSSDGMKNLTNAPCVGWNKMTTL